jgi:excisionase family DNA binding protein
MEKLYPMHEAIKILGVSLKTLQHWDKAGKIKTVRTPGGRRRVPESEIKRLLGEKEPVSAGRVLAIYARVSSGKLYGIRSRKKEEVASKIREVIVNAGYLPDENK